MFDSITVNGTEYPVEVVRVIEEGSFVQCIGFKTVIDGKTRGFQTKYHLELADELKLIHGVDLEEELMTMMRVELENEIKRTLESL